MIYVVMGPTCSGKTEVANAIMDKLGCEAINFDAFQIYKGMDIGTGKIDKDSKEYKIHYLLDIIDPSKTYSVKQYQEDFRKTLDSLLKEYKNIIK